MDAAVQEIPENLKVYLDEIATRLWDRRAAVMVGAGFSRNADEAFPTWNQLGDVLMEKLHGQGIDSNKKAYQNVLQLGEEYEASVGRPALDALLKANCNHPSARPSDLHMRLLRMPWVDVFTTNYDTLLEDTARGLSNVKYTPVYTSTDLAYAKKPRIVKLHGSFPSQRPFVFTQEDYREYPVVRAPFVNTVQQSLLENTFCLIGFSGDDPNFLQWIGWVRDNLGKDNAQKIYMIGAFGFSAAKLKMLERRGIVVVDMSLCGAISQSDHEKALAVAFSYIEQKNGDKATAKWPRAWESFETPKTVEEVEKLLHAVREDRLSYPGWFVLPAGKRRDLQLKTMLLRESGIQKIEGMPIDTVARFCVEMSWLYKRMLLPVDDMLANHIDLVVQKWGAVRDAEVKKNKGVFFLDVLSYCRINGVYEDWDRWHAALLDDGMALGQVDDDALKHEEILMAIFRLDTLDADKRLMDWRPDLVRPLWMLRRAGLLMEFGRREDAIANAMQSLESIRRGRCGGNELFSAGCESAAMLVVHRFKDESSPEEDVAYFERQGEFRKRNCDVGTELAELASEMKRNPAYMYAGKHEEYDFDVNRVNVSYSWSNSRGDCYRAFENLLLHELIGLPFRKHVLNTPEESLSGTLDRIALTTQNWATITATRYNAEKWLHQKYSRSMFSNVKASRCEELLELYLKVVSIWTCGAEKRQNDGFGALGHALRKASIEVLSRLMCKVSYAAKIKVLDFLQRAYSNSKVFSQCNIKNLLVRLVESLTVEEQSRCFQKFLLLPCPSNYIGEPGREFLHPFDVLPFVANGKGRRTKGFEYVVSNEDWRGLVDRFNGNSKSEREFAQKSIRGLLRVGLVSRERFRQVSQVVNYMDPYEKLLLPWAADEIAESVRQWGRTLKLKTFANNGTIISPIDVGAVQKVFVDLYNVACVRRDFWAKDIEYLVALVEGWWKESEAYFKNAATAVTEDIFPAFKTDGLLRNLVALIGWAFVPCVKDNAELLEKVEKLLQDIQDAKTPSMSARGVLAAMKGVVDDRLMSDIKEGIRSHNNRYRQDTVVALFKMASCFKSLDRTFRSVVAETLLGYLAWSDILDSVTVASCLAELLRTRLPVELSGLIDVLDDQLVRIKKIKEEAVDVGTPLPFERKLSLYIGAIQIASLLFAYGGKRAFPESEGVKYWRAVSQDQDEFVELRNAWRPGDLYEK